MKTWILAAACLLLSVNTANAASRGGNLLVANEVCPAYQSIAKKTNPGNVKTKLGQAYTIVADNKEPPTWLQIDIDGAKPPLRWVSVQCAAPGTDPAPEPVSQPPVPTPPPAGTTPVPPVGLGKATHLLALSWEPAFCETHSGKTECRGETRQSPEARQLSLHGLWPQPDGNFYCHADPQQVTLDKGSHFDQLAAPDITPATHDRLAAVMPGTQSALERHEWIKHGTCFGTSADVYFNRAADLTEQVNASAVGQLIAAHAGQTVQISDLVSAFSQAFGADARNAIVIKCASGELSEIDVYLAGDVTGSAPVANLLARAEGTTTCKSARLPVPKT
ncbi:ribonuclease T2 family protein [Asticcacaulis solisilvae]|uniref:ribonuclease T2 family protein n=1 Tax=Asticcacaulis solisilvae TaxID=1217274 RepID=UPI003FD70593